MIVGLFIGLAAGGVVLGLLVCICWKCGCCLTGEDDEADKKETKRASYRSMSSSGVRKIVADGVRRELFFTGFGSSAWCYI